MSIPDYQTIMLPLLQLAADGREHTKRETVSALADQFQLTEAERGTLLPSGRQGLFDNRVGWARTYLKQAGLLVPVRRGVFTITDQGLALLSRNPNRIDNDILDEYPAFREFKARTREGADQPPTPAPTTEATESKSIRTPDEQVREGYRALRANLAIDLLIRIQNASPAFFENLVVELLVAMGYGGTHEDAASVVGRSGDEGIDGIIKEDRLGLESIYLQAKRWKDSHTVGRPDVQQFAGALQGQRARKGVFITTSSFSREAVEYAKGLQTTIVLIDGSQLAELMLDYRIGVSVEDTIRLLKIDEDYFEEE
jgi:restriction system protein